MPKIAQNYPFPNRIRLLLDKETTVCHARVKVLRPCAILTWFNVDTAMTHGLVDYLCVAHRCVDYHVEMPRPCETLN